jgi:hypothetical protein
MSPPGAGFCQNENQILNQSWDRELAVTKWEQPESFLVDRSTIPHAPPTTWSENELSLTPHPPGAKNLHL